jgi:hypothetical protein
MTAKSSFGTVFISVKESDNFWLQEANISFLLNQEKRKKNGFNFSWCPLIFKHGLKILIIQTSFSFSSDDFFSYIIFTRTWNETQNLMKPRFH